MTRNPEHLNYWLTLGEARNISFVPPDDHVAEFALEAAAVELGVSVSDLLKLDARLRAATSELDLESIYLARDPAGVDPKFLIVSDQFVHKHIIRKFDPSPAAKSDFTPHQRKLNREKATIPAGGVPPPGN